MFAYRGHATLWSVVLIPRISAYETMRSEASLWSVHMRLCGLLVLALSALLDTPVLDMASVHRVHKKDSFDRTVRYFR